MEGLAELPGEQPQGMSDISAIARVFKFMTFKIIENLSSTNKCNTIG